MIEYTITVVNQGGVTYINVLNVTDMLPEGLLFNGTHKVSNANEIRFVNDGQKLTWTLTNISKDNATITLWVKVVGLGDLIKNSTFAHNITNNPKVDYVGSLTNNVTVTGPNGTTRDVNKTIYPVPIVDVSVIKISDRAVYFVDDIAVWTITVYNAGNGTNATNITLKDILPDKFEFINCTPGCDYNAATGIWTIGFMGNGTSRTINITSRVLDLVPNVINVTNVANVTCNETDWNLTNNVENETVKLVPLPDPLKAVNNITPFYHDLIEYTITVVNQGGVTYINVLNVTDGQKLTWTLTNISKDNATITLWVKVVGLGDLIMNSTFAQNVTNNPKVVYVGSLTNNVTVTGPNGTTRDVNKTIYPVPIVDLYVNITSDRDEYFVDDYAVWTITVYNAGNGTNATNVYLKDILPAQFEFVNCTSGDYNATTGIWTIGFMGNGTNVTINITTLAKTVGTGINNVVNVTGTEVEWNYTNNEANKLVDIVVLPQPVKTVDNYTPYNHDTVEYNLTITNNGIYTYESALTVVDSLPDGLIFNGTVSITGAKLINGTQDGQRITWIITNISSNTSAVITVKVFVNDIGNLTNNLTVIGPRGTNYTANCTIDPIPIADLEAIITNNFEGSSTDCHKGDTIVWTITVINHGPNDAVNTTLKDVLPEGLIYVSDDSGGAYDRVNAVWTIGNLTAGDSVILKITTVADTTNTVIFRNVTVSSDTHDPDLSNNQDNSSVAIPPEADLKVIKRVSDNAPHKGDKITWTIIVTNLGPDTAVNVVVKDKLPKGLVYVSDNSLNKYNHKTGKWNVGNLASGKSATLKIVALVATTDKMIVNVVDASSQTYDPNIANNHYERSTTVPPEADLVITITPDMKMVTVGEEIVYKVTVRNNGPDTAKNTRATIKLPGSLKLLLVEKAVGSYNPNTGIWDIGDLAAGKEVTLLLYTKALESGIIIVEASVESDTYETDLTNNNDSAEVIVKEAPEELDNATMHATGNPIVMALLALVALAGAGLKRRFR